MAVLLGNNCIKVNIVAGDREIDVEVKRISGTPSNVVRCICSVLFCVNHRLNKNIEVFLCKSYIQ